MDTSTEYIKMCNCLEMQSFDIRERFEDSNSYYKNNNILGIWLPRQDQLQEMSSFSHAERLFRFYEFLQKQFLYNENQWNSLDNISMEQLWLAFVMKEKFNKEWDGKNWVNNEVRNARD